jgi:hypothetical protein
VGAPAGAAPIAGRLADHLARERQIALVRPVLSVFGLFGHTLAGLVVG